MVYKTNAQLRKENALLRKVEKKAATRMKLIEENRKLKYGKYIDSGKRALSGAGKALGIGAKGIDRFIMQGAKRRR